MKERATFPFPTGASQLAYESGDCGNSEAEPVLELKAGTKG